MNAQLRQKFLQQYQVTGLETSVSEATPHKLVSMLYDGALSKIARARGFMQRNQFKEKAAEIAKITAILMSLRSNLDFEDGGEVALNLDALYEYMNRRILEAGRENSLEKLDEVAELIRIIKEGWEQMPDEFKNAPREKIAQLKLKKQ